MKQNYNCSFPEWPRSQDMVRFGDTSSSITTTKKKMVQLFQETVITPVKTLNMFYSGVVKDFLLGRG